MSVALEKKIIGFTVVSCFSQSKDELVIELNNSRESFFIKANPASGFSCLSFSEKFSRAKKNSVDLFTEIILKKIISVRQFQNERAFALELENNFSLVFKMYGSLSNVLLVNEYTVIQIFKNDFLSDFETDVHSLDRSVDFSLENFLKNKEYPEKIYFTFGKIVWSYLYEKQFHLLDIEPKWQLIQQTISLLENPMHYLIEENGGVTFSLLPLQNSLKISSNPIAAINEFSQRLMYARLFYSEKNDLLHALQLKLKNAENYLVKSRKKEEELSRGSHYQRWADLIMANLHSIKHGTEKISLIDFYDGSPVEIKLKRELNPQQNAGVFYRKAKNWQIEINKVNESILKKEEELRKLKVVKSAISQCADYKLLKEKIAEFRLEKRQTEKTNSLPYREYEWKGYKIWVGKNAQANDLLTLKHSYKEDLWLHVKDVAGSHVLIKYQPGKKFPKDVIEYAASIAAHYSKRKNETLCPVVVTPKKFVRKRKGDPAGTVVVEREEVILVEPKPEARG